MVLIKFFKSKEYRIYTTLDPENKIIILKWNIGEHLKYLWGNSINKKKKKEKKEKKRRRNREETWYHPN